LTVSWSSCPSDIEIGERAEAGLGLTSPEFAVLVAYAKLALKADLLPTGLPDDPWFQQTLADYFPPPIKEGFADAGTSTRCAARSSPTRSPTR
jgi:glutamate dehydrogenase